MKKRNIYQNQSQELLFLFENAGNNDKVMCINCVKSLRLKIIYGSADRMASDSSRGVPRQVDVIDGSLESASPCPSENQL